MRRIHSVLWWMLISVFALPYVFALIVSNGELRLPNEFFELCYRSFLQAAASTVATLVLGICGSAFLLRSGQSKRRLSYWEGIALVPSIAPSSAMVLGFIDLLPSWRGVAAVTAAHTLISMGFVSVILSRAIRDRLGASLELAWVEGASKTLMWRKAVLPALRSDFFRISVTLFFSSLASFSVPLLLGGPQAVTFEIAIHHAIRLENAWSVAAALSIFQLALLMGAVGLVMMGQAEGKIEEAVWARHRESLARFGVGRVIGSYLGFPAIVLGAGFVFFSILRQPLVGWSQLVSSGLFEHSESLWLALQGGLATSTLAGVLTGAVLLAFTLLFPTERKMRWMSSYVSPSTAITGFATLAFGWGQPPSFTWDVLRISIGSALLFAPLLWRLRWEKEVRLLRGQIQVARTLGANHRLIATRILLPKLKTTFFWTAGIVSFWMWGDYALGSIAASRSMTTGMLAKSLMESYRLEAASLVIFVSLCAGAVSYRFFTWGGLRVSR